MPPSAVKFSANRSEYSASRRDPAFALSPPRQGDGLPPKSRRAKRENEIAFAIGKPDSGLIQQRGSDARTLFRSAPALVSLVLAMASGGVAPRVSGQAGASGVRARSTANGPATARHQGSRTATRSDHAANFNKLEVAWRFKTDNLGPRPSTSSRHAADDQGHALRDGGTARDRRARREDRRAEMGLQHG